MKQVKLTMVCDFCGKEFVCYKRYRHLNNNSLEEMKMRNALILQTAKEVELEKEIKIKDCGIIKTYASEICCLCFKCLDKICKK